MSPSSDPSPRPAKRTGVMAFLRGVYAEGAKVTWPSRREASLTAVMVMIMTVLSAIFFFLTDQVVSRVVKLILGFGG